MERLQFEDCINYAEGEVYAYKIFNLDVDTANKLTDTLTKTAVHYFLETLRYDNKQLVDIESVKELFIQNNGLTVYEYGWVMYNLKFVITQAKIIATQEWAKEKALEAEEKAETKVISLKHRNPGTDGER